MLKIYCDNEKVVKILNKEDIPLSNEIQTILVEIMDMNIEVRHIKGTDNFLADALTRNTAKKLKKNNRKRKKEKTAQERPDKKCKK